MSFKCCWFFSSLVDVECTLTSDFNLGYCLLLVYPAHNHTRAYTRSIQQLQKGKVNTRSFFVTLAKENNFSFRFSAFFTSPECELCLSTKNDYNFASLPSRFMLLVKRKKSHGRRRLLASETRLSLLVLVLHQFSFPFTFSLLSKIILETKSKLCANEKAERHFNYKK